MPTPPLDRVLGTPASSQSLVRDFLKLTGSPRCSGILSREGAILIGLGDKINPLLGVGGVAG